MNELSPEVQASIVKAAHEASLEDTNMKLSDKKGAKSFSQLYCKAFAKNYNILMEIVAPKAEEAPESSMP